jgi:hypothetical protein
MAIDNGVRAIEDGVQTDFSARMDYGSYLALDTLLSAQRRPATITTSRSSSSSTRRPSCG